MQLDHTTQVLLIAVLTLPVIYIGARVACTAYFHAKLDYQRKLLNQIDKGVV